MSEFNVGDEVIGIGEHEGKRVEGIKGVIKIIQGDVYGVAWEQNVGGHSVEGKAPPGHGWNVFKSHMKLLKVAVAAGRMLDQLVLPEGHRKAIMEALVQEDEAKRKKLFVEWGFDKTFEKGKGLVFMFYGEPGTGKTMCAQAVAEHLGRKWMLISTGDLESSVPGQMERNVAEAFSQAKKNKLVLIFDECDSLLYNRNQVGAILGAQINALLSAIEHFDGTCILTTNRSILLDPALERRIALKLEFKRPDAEMRKKIWRNLIPKECPLHKDVDINKIAEDCELPGGNIKNIILAAARRAVYNDKDSVSKDDLYVAIEKEIEGQDAFKNKLPKSTLKEFFDNINSGNGIERTIERTVRRTRKAVVGNGTS